MDRHRKAIERNFNRILQKIEEIEVLINQKSGFWVLESHVHTQADLMEKLTGGRLAAQLGTFTRNVQSWDESGSLSEEDREFYDDRLYEVETAIHEAKMTVLKRQPTGMEKVLEGLQQLADKVFEILPISPPKLLSQQNQKLLEAWDE